MNVRTANIRRIIDILFYCMHDQVSPALVRCNAGMTCESSEGQNWRERNSHVKWRATIRDRRSSEKPQQLRKWKEKREKKRKNFPWFLYPKGTCHVSTFTMVVIVPFVSPSLFSFFPFHFLSCCGFSVDRLSLIVARQFTCEFRSLQFCPSLLSQVIPALHLTRAGETWSCMQ